MIVPMDEPQRQPRPTYDDIDERVEFLRNLIGSGVPRKSLLKKAFRQKFGDTDATTIERYLTRAKQAILADVAVGREMKRAYKSEFYGRISADKNVPMKERLRAAELEDKVLGLQQHGLELSGPDGAPIQQQVDISQLTEEQKDAILKADAILSGVRELQPNRPGDPGGAGEELASRNGHPG